MGINPFPMKTAALIAGILSFAALHAFAEAPEPVAPQPAAPGPFDRGTWEVEGGSGFYGSFSSRTNKRVTINYQMEDLRLGWMYDSPRHSGWLRGNNEFLLEGFGGETTKGPDGFLAGGDVLWRYNFIQPETRWIPYFQLGAGMLGNNIYRGLGQREIGEGFEFLLQGGVGVKYLINDQWSVALEGGWRHISNADLAPRNQGLNSLGGLLQVTYRFH